MPSAKLKLLQDAILTGNIPALVLNMISYAIEIGTSDIHVEPQKNTIRLRYRIDGVLRGIVEYPHNLHPAVVSRIKIMSNLKIDEQRIPQDGRCHVTTEEAKEMDLRVSTLPTPNGEKIVMRIQDESKEVPTLEQLGIEGVCLEWINYGLEAPNGIMLTSGPTGSGKTTTLYSCLNILNTIDVNIMTIEDPVEIALEGLNQSQVHPDISYTFATGLRTALRQDPDIIMVGEIRDHETINIAIEAALTGHLVLSTIHTNSAVETITRIDNMGIPAYLMTGSLIIIIAQRLVRRICKNCRMPEEIDPETIEMIRPEAARVPDTENIDHEKLEKLQFFKGKGCDVCDGSGYKGRVGLYEVLRISDPVRQMILDKKSTMDIEEQGRKEGMVNLFQSGIIKALRGETTVEEILSAARRKG